MGARSRIVGISLAGAEPDWGSEMMTSGGCVEPEIHLKQGVKYDDGKIPYHLISVEFERGLAQVLAFGAQKYEPWNWAKGIVYSRLYRAACGHLHDWYEGQDNDEETGLNHLFHAACCLMFLCHYVSYTQYERFDDRPDFEVLGADTE